MNTVTSRAKGLTRLAVIIGLIIAAVSFFSNQSAQASNEVAKTSFTYVTVHNGETLWQIAERVAPNQDPRDTVEAIVTLNNLTQSTLQPGQRIALPNF
ncbi:unannotated protein [freshwater metagenome]|jgi:LysM repeat protein|uniref:Unannotated protein n=1 Tax=freshwater metagenome TaxID=449393 RepID=A0A6J7K8D7_9ZZZZ|nr:LysM peptidoglycan-binding domain-containing protein [Actinomycetota bacterium]